MRLISGTVCVAACLLLNSTAGASGQRGTSRQVHAVSGAAKHGRRSYSATALVGESLRQVHR
jgi:hypothetical protein